MRYFIGKVLFKVLRTAGKCLAVFLLQNYIKRGNVKMATTTKSVTTTVLTNAAAIALAYLANKASDDSTSWTTYKNAIVQSSLSSILSALTTSSATTTSTDTTAQS
jgi:hypothetical protein